MIKFLKLTGIFLFFLVTAQSAQAGLGEWGGTGQTAGAIQEVPEGYALTAIGYGSDDHKCVIGIKTAPVRSDGSVDFANKDGSWRSVGCGEGTPGASRNNYEKYFDPAAPEVATGWTWGTDTSGGNGSNDGFPADECFYQEYMDLRTGATFGWGESYDGTCNDRGYNDGSWLKRVAYAPAGRVITGIRFNLDDDARLQYLALKTRDVVAEAGIDAYVGTNPGQTAINLTYNKSTGQTTFSPSDFLTVKNIGQTGSSLDWESDLIFNNQSSTGEFLTRNPPSGDNLSVSETQTISVAILGLSDKSPGTYDNAASIIFSGTDPLRDDISVGSITLQVNLTITDTIPPPSCSPSSQTINLNQQANFTAAGGNGSYSWSASGGSPSSGSGSAFSTSYSTSGSKTVTVTSSG